MEDAQKQAVSALRSRGKSYAQIAGCLGLSPNTVKSFCRRSKITPVLQAGTGDAENACKNCGAALAQTPGGRKKKFCSDRCRYAWWNRNRRGKPYRLACRHCGRTFISFGNKNRAFCSRECYALSRHN